jgi:pimeloyl-ACP methyl ester carboxylesterase
MRIASTDGVTLELLELGGDGPPVLIAHANGFCGGAYQPLVPTLADHHRVWALDLRAHGGSTAPTGADISWQGMIDDVLAAVDAIGAPVHGFGHSLGGACLLGAEGRRPGTLRSAWVYEPIVIPPEWEGQAPGDNPLAAAARRRRPTFGSKAEALARYASRPPLGLLRADALAAYVEHGFADQADGTVTLRCTPDDEARVFEAPGKPSFADVAGVDVDVVVAHGMREPWGPQAFAPRVAEVLPRGRVRAYDHLGHFGPLEDPTTIAADAVAHFAEN